MAEHGATSGADGRAAATGDAAPAVRLSGITKAYPGVLANDRIDLEVRGGEVHCLLGENGAGKSTLMGILSGMVAPDAGTISVGGREVRIDSPRAAIDLGMGMVYQHTTPACASTPRGPGPGWPRSPGCSGSRWTPTRRPARWPWASSSRSRS
jgi:simple sugar transport system ATP-binding protein